MRFSCWLPVALVVASCALVPEGQDPPPAIVDVDALDRTDLGKRFPGIERIDLVKLLRVPEPPGGGCVADFDPSPEASRVDGSWRTDEGTTELSDETLDAFGRDGWLPAYRTPIGVGFEKSARFREIDLEMRQTLVCRCYDRDRPELRVPTVLRLRWSEGEAVRVSAAVAAGDDEVGVSPAIVAGRLVRYGFRLAHPMPGRAATSCAGRLEVDLLVTPPFV